MFRLIRIPLGIRPWMWGMFSDTTELDQEIVGALIEKVLVYDPRHVEIRWKFSDEVLKLLQG